jgi:hypothetical protein
MKLSKKFAILAAAVLACALWRPAVAIVTNAIIDLVQISAPSNPASGNARLYVNSGTQLLSCLLPGGGSCMPSGGGSGFIQTLTAPTAGSFTQVNYNVGSGVTTTQTNNSTPVTSITVVQNDPNNVANVAMLVQSKIASTFTVTMAYTASGNYDGGAGGIAGMCIYDGSSTVIFMGMQSGEGFRIPIIASIGGGFSADVAGPVVNAPFGPLAWTRIQETASARIYSVSTDGNVWEQYTAESNTAHFTTASYGLCVEVRGASANSPASMATMYSFTQTNP